ncbi:hypothetical protein WN944_027758 [Citrus x changshan-huyou]|uniref:UDP-N-acetylenolpyruvoylglucosamine reductase C-terminal domain-containing protein n=1 Tax=Citrus x changshan-huyou TaxID=2935761 RepID=A0AAP0LII9_9ROSI
MLQPIRESFFQRILNFIKTLEEISNVHANFLVNVGDSTSRDMLNLIAFVKEKIEAERGAMAKKSSRSAGQLLKRKRNPWQMPAKIDEVKAKEFGGKMQSKYGQWVKTDFDV